MRKILTKSIVFVLIGMFLFGALQYVLVQKFDYPVNTDGITRTVKGLYAEDKESIDVVFLGTSHMAVGVSPMEMYENYGIISYNLGTSRQPTEVSYYLLKEALKTQNPKLVVLDVSSLFLAGTVDESWRYVMDSMPLSQNKLELIKAYEEKMEEADSVSSLIFPIAKYHIRWKDLVDNDFSWLPYQRPYYTKGYVLRSQLGAYETSVEDMNVLSEKDTASVSDNNLAYLEKIKQLCDEEGMELLLTKIPSVYNLDDYASAWTTKKSEIMKEICQKKDIQFWDILYDAGMEIDLELDSMDGGKHFNIIGAEKVSDMIGEYLVEHYDIKQKQSTQYDKDLVVYQQIRKMGLLELKQEFSEYITTLNESKEDYVIVMAASKNFPGYLTEEDRQALYALGITEDLGNEEPKSFIAVIDGGQVMCESLSGKKLNYQYEDENQNLYSILSNSGSAEVSITIEGEECAQVKDGVNIVVFDKKTQGVVDSVAFNPWTEEFKAERTNKSTENFLKGYEDYYIKNSDELIGRNTSGE